MAKHPGFKAVQNKIAAQEGVGKKASGAILAASTRKASPAAKKMNQIAAQEGVGKKASGAILAASTRKASPAAKKMNPKLKKVK